MFRHCHGHPFDLAHAPILLSGVATSYCVFMVDTELFQVPDLGSRVLPLLPDKAAKSPDDPSFQRFEAFAVDSEVIGVSDEFMTPFLQLLVQFVKHHVGKQRRCRTALGSSLVSIGDHAVDHRPGNEVSAYQLQYALVFYPHRQSTHQPIMVHPVEKLRQIHIDNIGVSLKQVLLGLQNSVVGRSSGSGVQGSFSIAGRWLPGVRLSATLRTFPPAVAVCS